MQAVFKTCPNQIMVRYEEQISMDPAVKSAASSSKHIQTEDQQPTLFPSLSHWLPVVQL